MQINKNATSRHNITRLTLRLSVAGVSAYGTVLGSPCSTVLLPRLMRPDDANVFGSVHGGTILRMIEEAGGIISTRHCNTQDGVRTVTPGGVICLCMAKPRHWNTVKYI